MSYRVTTLSALQANLSAANTTMILCRANIGRLPMTPEDRNDTVSLIRKQIGELEAMILELTRPNLRKRCSPVLNSRSRRLVREQEAKARAGMDT